MRLSDLRPMIQTSRLGLRKLTLEDANERYVGWLNDPEVNVYLETRTATVQGIRDYIDKKSSSDTALLLGIYWQQNDDFIGTVKLEPIDFATGVATMGILIGDKVYWGKGVATEVVNAITEYAFNSLGLSEVNLGVLGANLPAIRVYEKCGFATYQVDKNARQHGDATYDQVWMRRNK